MKDIFATNHLGIRALTTGSRIVRRSSVSIAGDRYGGVCLAGMDGKKVLVSCVDCYGLEYAVANMLGKTIGHIRYIREKTPLTSRDD